MWKITWIQLMNRWRSNVWVCVELLLAFCLAWYMVDYFLVEIYNRSLPSGRGYANVWQVEMGLLPETSPDYRAAESDSIAMLGNYERIKDRLRDYPGVQAMGAASAVTPRLIRAVITVSVWRTRPIRVSGKRS